MAADTNDLVKKVGIGTATTLSAPGKAMAAASITVGSTANFPSTTGIIVAIRVVDSNGEMVAGTYTEWSATVSSGTTLALVTTPVYGTDQVYTAGSTTQVYMPLSSYGYNKFADAFIAEHSQLDGTHAVELITSRTEDTNPDPDADFVLTYDTSATALKKVKLENLSGSGSGWIPNVLPAPDTVTNNGNRSYDLVFNSTDLTDTVSEGMRLRTTRTVSAPTQCTDLESGSSQFASLASASVTGCTFTTAFTCMAWIKPESYVNGAIISRTDGTSGWFMELQADGTLRVVGDAGATIDSATTYQSVVLNKWQHVAVTMDLVANTVLTYIDGVSVPNSAASATAALVQAGNLQVGARTGGTFFDGKIAQAAVFSSVLSAATIRSYASQGLTGSESTAVAVYPLNGDFNDATSNNNDLVASGGAVATNVDSPFGSYLGGTLEYGIITKTAFSTNTTLTVQVPEGCAIPTSGGVSAVSYSKDAVPYLFPKSEGRWEIVSLLGTNSATTSNATFGSFISGGWKLNVPIGRFNLGWKALLDNAVTVSIYFHPSLTSLTGLAATAAALVSPYQARTISAAAANSSYYATIFEPQAITAATDFTMYTLGASTSGAVRGDLGYCVLKAIPDYL